MSETILNAEQTAPEAPDVGDDSLSFAPVCLGSTTTAEQRIVCVT